VAKKVAGETDRLKKVVGDDCATRARGGIVPTKSRNPTPLPAGMRRVYEWFLDWFLKLPPVVVLTVLWVAGAALLISYALVLYVAGSVLVWLVAGLL
jgi:bacteriorhodopsin